jgi:nicotinamide-nucleotide amidase
VRVELINTGTELMLGLTLNTHLSWIARRLSDVGLRLDRQTTVGDDRAELRATVAEALGRSELVLVTGGLGPTADDCTREVVAELLGRRLARDDGVAAAIAERYRARGLRMPDSVNTQALVPEAARVLVNRNGTAPGLALEHEGGLVVLLPGPPRELIPMLDEQVLPLLRARFGAVAPLLCRVFKVVGVAESVVEEKVAPALAELAGIELGYCARMGEVEVRIISASAAAAGEAERRVRAALGDAVYGLGDDRLEEVVVRMLAGAGRRIALAESCTGGLIAHRLSNVSGSSAVFLSGVVSYSNESKVRLLGVREESLARFGAVSEEVAREMAEGARVRSGADFGVSTTGIAGPSGGTPEKPVGLVYVGLATSSGTRVARERLLFDRETFKFFASQTALDAVRRSLLAGA